MHTLLLDKQDSNTHAYPPRMHAQHTTLTKTLETGEQYPSIHNQSCRQHLAQFADQILLLLRM